MEYLRNAGDAGFTVWHNGDRVLTCGTGTEVLDYIAYILNLYIDGDPRCVVDEVLDTCTETGGKRLLLAYEYIDTCREIFLVEMGRGVPS